MSGLAPTTSGSNDRRRKTTNAVMITLSYLCTIAALIPLVAIIAYVVIKGAVAWDADFFTGLPQSFGTGGGVSNAIVGSGIIVLTSCVIGIPVGVLSGIYLAEYGDNRFGSALRFVADVMTGAPSVVIGILGYSLFVLTTGNTAGIYGSVALAVLMLPVITRSTEEIVRLVPGDLREASLALGIPRWKTILRVVVPTALSGIVTGVLLAVARVSGETAPLIFTVGVSNFMNYNPFEGPMETLPTLVYRLSSQASGDVIDNAWGGALLLLLIVVVLNLVARLIFRGRSVR